jgi:hypothetical protein
MRATLAIALTALTLLTGTVHARTCAPPRDNNWTAWLQRQEAAGGHTLACHTGISENGLIGRLTNRSGHQGDACIPGGVAASAWSGANGDYSSLINAISGAIADEAPRFDAMPAGNLQLSGTAAQSVGKVVRPIADGNNRHACPKNSRYACTATRTWVAVVRFTDDDCYLLTAYPN